MIEQISIKNFKSFKDVNLKLGPLNIFIGPNASGKSNFFDALRVLQGIGYGFTLREILDGKPKSATSEVWEGIRGGSANVPFAFKDADEPTSFQVAGTLADGNRLPFELRIAFWPKEGRFCREELSVSGEPVYDFSADDSTVSDLSSPVQHYTDTENQSYRNTVRVQTDRPMLTQAACRGDAARSEVRPRMGNQVAYVFGDMQLFRPSLPLLRAYSQAYEMKRMEDRGENFAALMKMICADSDVKEAYLGWLRELRPHEVDDVETRSGALREPMFVMKERAHEWLAPVLSDGTLRFAAITAAFFQFDMPGILTIEEIENGIHASRLRLLVELLRSRAAEGKTQVMVTTHSPLILAWLKPEEYATTFYCKRDEETGESHVCPLSEIPRFNEIVSKQSISDLFAEGWMETAL